MEESSEVVAEYNKLSREKTLIVILGLLLLVAAVSSGYLFWQNQVLQRQIASIVATNNTLASNTSVGESKIGYLTPTVYQVNGPLLSPTPPPTVIQQYSVPSGWKRYLNNDVGLSFYYPPTMRLIANEVAASEMATGEQQFPLAVRVCIRSLSPEPTGHMQYQGYCEHIDDIWSGFSVDSSRYIYQIGTVQAKSATVLSQFEVCDVRFYRKLGFRWHDYEVGITVTADSETVISAIGQYLVADHDNCFGGKRWDFENEDTDFYKDVSEGQLSGIVQDWYDYYDQLIASIRLSDE